MSNKLDKFYNTFGGLDSRSNKLLQNPETCREGSKNFRYDFQDQLTKANGFQRKSIGEMIGMTDTTSFCDAGIVEYKYTDINTGESKSKLLGVSKLGYLYLKEYHALKASIVDPNNQLAFSYYLDDDGVFKVVINGETIAVGLTDTMDDLATAINAVAAGYTVSVVDQDGAAVVGSTKLAYLGDVVVDTEISDDEIFHESWFFTPVKYPTSTFALPFGNEVPFSTTGTFYGDEGYEGLSYVNINNSVYITDGGFPIKYDGYQAYRMGMPRLYGSPTGTSTFSALDGFQLTAVTGTGLIAGTYRYIFQHGFVDPNGVEILGAYGNSLAIAVTGGSRDVQITYRPIRTTNLFPVYSCVIDGDFAVTAMATTFNVESDHNIQIGMVLRVPIDNAVLALPGISYWYPEVTDVTATTITVNFPTGVTGNLRAKGSASFTFLDNQVVTAGYTAEFNKDTITEPVINGGSYLIPPILAGAFVRVYRSTVNTTAYSKLIDLPVRYEAAGIPTPPTFIDEYPDTGSGENLSSVAFNELDGQELPRACKYLNEYQGLIIQGGRPIDGTLATQQYPTTYLPLVSAWGLTVPLETDYQGYYTEAGICDFQSIYWSDSNNPEGFSQDGLSEIRITSTFNDSLTGFAPNKDALFAFKQRTTALITGDLINNVVNLEILEADVGCVSHRSIKEVGGTLIWLDGDDGFFSCIAGRLPEPIGYPISDYQKLNLTKLNYKNAVAADLKTENLYFCSVGTTTFVYDYGQYGINTRNCWYLWDRINIISAIDTANNKYLVSDGLYLWQLKVTNTKYDYSDHTDPIAFSFVTAWISQGAPIIDKKQIGVWINSIQGGFSLSVDQYVNFLNYVISTYDNLEFIAETASKKAIKEQVKAAIPKCVAVSYGFRNNVLNEAIKIQGFELQYATDYDSGEPKR